MLLPNSYEAALLLTIFTMLCWGSWANTQKLAGKWRFELFYFDFALGVLLCALIAGLTFGQFNSGEITALDAFQLSGLRKSAFGLGAGIVFNLANMLLVAAIAVAGLSVAFPIGIGLALVIGVVWNYALNPQGNPTLLFVGSALVAAAIVVDAIAYRLFSAFRAKRAVSSKAPVAARPQGVRMPAPAAPATSGSLKGIVLSLVSGVLMGSFYPLVEMGKSGGDGLPSYSIAIVFAVGVFVSTFVFSLFFLLMPVQGDPVPLWDYFKGSKKQHLLGVFGGMIWMAGAVANFVASSTPESVQVGPAVSYAMGQGATLISALWGLLVWKEFAGATPRVRLLLAIMLGLFVAGLVLVSIAPLYSHP